MPDSNAPATLHAVITADLVESTKRLSLDRREAFADALREAYAKLQEALPDALPYPLAIFSGDSWQCYVHEPEAALRAGLYLRAWARHIFDVDTRFALAIGTVDFVNEQNVGESDGAAFRISGRMAKDLSGEDRLLIYSAVGKDDRFRRLEEVTDELLYVADGAIARLADCVARAWTAAQAQAILWRLLDPEITQEEIAERWTPESVTRQAIAKHLSSGGWNDLDSALHYYKRLSESAVSFATLLNATSPHWNG